VRVLVKEDLKPQPQPGTDILGSEESPFDDLASAYDAWFEDEGKLIFSIEVEAFRKILPSLPKPWLEVGVGSGRFAKALDIKMGIDPSAKLLEIAKRQGINVFLGKGEGRFFDEGSFGTVFLIVTLCFVDSPVAVLQEAYRILKPGGKIVLGLVLSGSPWGQYYLTKKNEGHRFYKHATFYSYQETTELLEHTGFAVDKIISTLFQKPYKVQAMEMPLEEFSPDAGFTIVVAVKAPEESEKQTKRHV
jgi:SAM-dependent methyltransferase